MQSTPTIQRDHAQAQMGYRQKSSAISLFVAGSSVIYYWARVEEMRQTFPLIGAAENSQALPTGYTSLVIGIVVVLVITEIVLQSVLAIGTGELATAVAHNKEVERKATRNSHALLMACVVATVASILLGLNQFFSVNLLFSSFMLAEIVRLISQLVYYRQAQQPVA